MVKVNNDAFLIGLSKQYSQAKDSGPITLTIKRTIAPPNNKYKPGNKFKNGLINNMKKAFEENPKMKFNVDIKMKTNNKQQSTTVDGDKAVNLGNSLVSLFRINFFKIPKILKKKIKKATPKDPKSKRTQKLKSRIQFKKLKKIKRKERKLFKKKTTTTGTVGATSTTGQKLGDKTAKIDIE